MYFKYIGYDNDKKIFKGTVEAPSSREAIQELEREGVSVILDLKPARGLLFKKRLLSLKDKLLKSPFGRVLKKSTVEIEIKDSEVLKLLKKLESQEMQIGEKINDIFAQPMEKIEFREKTKRRVREKEIDWEKIKQSPENIKKLRIPFKEIIYFTRQLSVLLSSGVSLPTSLLTLSEHTRNKKMKRIIKQINQEVQEGNSLSSAMASFPNQFNDLYVSLVFVGESSGTLPECLKDLAEFQELQQKIRKKIRSSLVYPAIIIIVVVLLLILGSHFFIPMFEELFEDMGMELPQLTKTIFWLAGYTQHIVVGVLVLIVFFFIAAPHMGSVYKAIRQVTDKLFLKLPVFKRITLTLSMFYFTNPLALMQKNGVRLVDSLRMVYNVVPNHVIKEEIQDATYLLMEGVSISEALAEQPHFDSVICSMIKTGEDSGRIEQTLEHLSNYYSEQLEADSETLMQMIQPITILLIAAVVIPIVFAIFIPLLDLTSGSFIKEGL